MCFTIGLQNAIITRISNSVIRRTHITGMVTDIGIGFGRVLWSSVTRSDTPLAAEWSSLRLLSSLIGLFFTGGVIGAIGFKRLGFLFILPLAFIVVGLAFLPIMDDVRRSIGSSSKSKP